MKVKQLIAKLQKADPEALVVHFDDYSDEPTPLIVMKDTSCLKHTETPNNAFVLTWDPEYTR